MLPFHGRWRNASKRALEREARLLMYAIGPDDDEEEGDEGEVIGNVAGGRAEGAGEQEQGEGRGEAHAGVSEQVAAIAEFERRKFKRALQPQDGNEGVSSFEILSEATETVTQMHDLQQKIAVTGEMIREVNEKDPEYLGESVSIQLNGYKTTVDTIRRHVESRREAMQELQLVQWEHGELPPGVFVANLERYVSKTQAMDAQGTSDDERKRTDLIAQRMKTEGSAELSEFDKAEQIRSFDREIAILTRRIEDLPARTHARRSLLENARREYENINRRKPSGLAYDLVKDRIASPEELWTYYDINEKKDIIRGMNRESGMDALLGETMETINRIRKPLDSANLAHKIIELQKNLKITQMELLKKERLGLPDETVTDSASTTLQTRAADILRLPQRLVKGVNATLGIEWTNLGEIADGFTKLMESIAEGKKRRRLGRVAHNALLMGRIASIIPGMGGRDLVQVLAEQQEGEQNEVKDSFKKELGDSRNDFGFTDLFGNDGNGGRLKEFANAGDMNRTRAVLEFAAGKGLLFDIEEQSANEYVFPGNYKIHDIVPKDWNTAQVDTYFDNLKYMNNEGKAAARKAGAQYVAGRSNADGYVEPFQGAVNSLSIWFARGIVDKAMEKVSDGEMSTRLTLAIVDAWENSALFRRYVPREWLDSICGVGKQMLIGMIKYEKDILRDAARNGETDISKAKDDKDGNESQLGKMVVAARQYLLKLDPSIAPNGDKKKKAKFDLMLSKLLASQTVTLPNKKKATIYSEELAPLHIHYYPDQMRDVPVAELGDDFFIKRSEIIRGNLEVYRAVGAVNQSGFANPVKARYFFSHIISAYEELKDLAKSGDPAQRVEMARAAEVLRSKARPNMDGWIEKALANSGAAMVLSEQHKDQNGRYLVLTLLELGLISIEKIEQMAGGNNKYALQLLESLAKSKNIEPEMKRQAQASYELHKKGGGRRAA